MNALARRVLQRYLRFLFLIDNIGIPRFLHRMRFAESGVKFLLFSAVMSCVKMVAW